MKNIQRTILFLTCFIVSSFLLATQVYGTDAHSVEEWLPFAWFDSSEERQELIRKLEPGENKKRSFIDILHYRLLTNGKATLAVIGSSVTKGSGATTYSFSWAGRLESRLRRINWDFKRLEFVNFGFSGFSSRDLLLEGKAEALVLKNPDLIIFETSILNDHTKSVPIHETLNSIERIVTIFSENAPDAVMLLTSPNPSSRKINGRNAQGLTYRDYLNETERFIRSKGWHYVDIHSEMEMVRKNLRLPLDAILSDGLHPNDIGYQLWFKTLYERLDERVEGL